MHESLLLGVVTVFVLGLGARWNAWRFRSLSVPLVFVARPATGAVLTLRGASAGGLLFLGRGSLRTGGRPVVFTGSLEDGRAGEIAGGNDPTRPPVPPRA